MRPIEHLDWQNNGSTISVRALTDVGEDWLQANLDYEPWQKTGDWVVGDWRPMHELWCLYREHSLPNLYE